MSTIDPQDRLRRDDLSAGYGRLLFHAENPAGPVQRRTVRWVLLVGLALGLSVVIVLYIVGFADAEPGDAPPWWFYPPLLGSWLLLLWGVGELLDLLTAWLHVGWSVDVYERGVIESRYGTVRQSMPYTGGVIDFRGALFTSPRPQVGSGRLAALWRGEMKQAPSELRSAAQPILVREALAQLHTGHTVTFPGKRDDKPGITLTPDLLRLPDGREYGFSKMRMQYSIDDGMGGRTITDDPARANTVGFADSRGDSVPGLHRTSPNLAVVRETLHIIVDPDGHRTMFHTQRSRQEQE